MRLKIEYIANYLGIDIANPLCLTDIGEIKDIDMFIVFMKSNIKNTRLSYLNSLQKLNELKIMFSEEMNSDRVEKAENHAFLLAEKFRTIKPIIKRMFEEFKSPSLENFEKDGIRYFEPFELKTLNKLGDIKKIVYFDDNMILEDKISKQFTNMIYSNAHRSIEHSQKSTNESSDDTSVRSLVNLALKGNK